MTGRTIRYTALPAAALRIGALLNRSMREASELLPRYRMDNILDSAAFTDRLPKLPHYLVPRRDLKHPEELALFLVIYDPQENPRVTQAR